MPEQLNLSTLKPAEARRDRKRVGRGLGSGKGRYSGRGIKGQKSRSGSAKMRAGFEGGQMPLHMRLGKLRGPYSKDAMPVGPHRTFTQAVNLRDLEARFDAGADVTLESLREVGLIKNTKIDVKILASGELTKKLTVTAHRFSRRREGEDRGRRRHRHRAARNGQRSEEAALRRAPAGEGRRPTSQESAEETEATRQPAAEEENEG